MVFYLYCYVWIAEDLLCCIALFVWLTCVGLVGCCLASFRLLIVV